MRKMSEKSENWLKSWKILRIEKNCEHYLKLKIYENYWK